MGPFSKEHPMTRKQDFIRSEQNRDKHPDSPMKGSAASVQEEQARQGAASAADPDKQPAHTPKVANDHNKVGDTHPTQKNEGQRTPQSRHDRQNVSGGSMNSVEARTGGKGGGRGTRGGNVGGAG
jgi:hypothetical protein